jgi:hypothetical protein
MRIKSGTRHGARIKLRRRWKINPKTRIKKSGKIYSRKKLKAVLRKSDKL